MSTMLIHAFGLCFTSWFASMGEEWPQFRGPGGAGASSEAELPVEWSAEKNLAWKVDAPGRGWSSPIVWGDKVILTAAYSLEEPKSEPEEEGDGREQPGSNRGRPGRT